MANTRQSAKRARQALKRRDRNQLVSSATKSAVKKAITLITGKDAAAAKDAYKTAMQVLSKAASRGAMPGNRAARKTRRLAHLLQKTHPSAK